jgi:DNA-binding PadR family transcriptional regulator
MKRWNESAYLLLAALAEGDNHGYALAQRVEELSDGHVTVGPGTLYGVLDRLQQAQLIELRREIVVDGRNRRVFGLTGSGRDALHQRADQLARRAVTMQRALGLT